MIELTDNPDVVAADFDMAKRMAETLHEHYPGHLWGVQCDHEQGIARVFNMRLSGRWGFVIKLKDIINDPGLKKVIMAGGELLERYRMKRGMFDQHQYDDLQTDFTGNFKPDI